MNKKLFNEIAAIFESKFDNSFGIIEIADLFASNFKNFDRKKFLLACGLEKDFTYDELLNDFFQAVDNTVNQRVVIITGP